MSEIRVTHETGDVRPVIERLGADLASALRHERELADDRDDWKRRAEVAEAEIKALKSDLERARYAPLGENHHNAAACPYCRPKLASRPLASDWPKWIAAMDPWEAGDGDESCFFCARPKWSVGASGHREHCLWQNAVDALPPSSAKDGDA
jgi:hypothetical protein